MHGPPLSSKDAIQPLSNAEAGFSAALIVIVGAGTLLAEAAGLNGLRMVARAGVLLWLLLNLRRMRGIELIFLSAAAAVVVLVVALSADPIGVLGVSLDRAGLFLTFVSSLNLLRDAARSSTAVRRGGYYLISQSPARRYAALTLGCHLFTIVLNMGALTLLGAMVMRSNTLAAAGGDPTVVAIRERRMVTALIRGFGATFMWTPTGISVGYILSLVPTLTWFDMLPVAVGLSFACMLIGWIVDRLQWRSSARRAALPPPPVSPRELLPMLGVTALILLSVLAAKFLFSLGLLVAVLSTVPFVAALWLVIQHWRFGLAAAISVTRRRLRRHAIDLLPQTRPESVVLGSAAFMGVGISALVEAGGIGAWLSSVQLPGPAVAIGAFLLVLLLAQVGVTPLITVTIVGTTIMQMSPLPIPPLALVIALQAAWSLSSSISPYTGGTLTLARMLGKPSSIVQQWNATYGVACSALIVVMYLVWLL